jgi:hypothetical protein
VVTDPGSSSFQVFAEFRVKFGDPKARYFLIFRLGVALQFQDKLFSFHVVKSDIDIVRFFAHDLS